MKIILFGGTTEGRLLAKRYMAEDLLVCVTSDYARQLLPAGVRCIARPLDAAQMLELMRFEKPDRVIDATHPFAVQASENIRQCTAALHIPYERIERAEGDRAQWRDDVQWAEDTCAAVEALKSTAGNILLTVGSHTLEHYIQAIDPSRLYARVLPVASSLALCKALPPDHILAMQGPFSRAFNAALYAQWDIRVMVSKDSGDAGGVTDKVLAALMQGVHVIMIQRPKEGNPCRGNA